MRMAKASELDLEMAQELCSALDQLTRPWGATVPDKASSEKGDDESELFDIDDHEQCRRILSYLVSLARRASLLRVVGCAVVMLDPKNKLVDPAKDYLDYHPDFNAGMEAKKPRPLSEWTEEMGDVLWWTSPVDEAPWCGTPICSDWPGYHTHFTPLIMPNMDACGFPKPEA